MTPSLASKKQQYLDAMKASKRDYQADVLLAETEMRNRMLNLGKEGQKPKIRKPMKTTPPAIVSPTVTPAKDTLDVVKETAPKPGTGDTGKDPVTHKDPAPAPAPEKQGMPWKGIGNVTASLILAALGGYGLYKGYQAIKGDDEEEKDTYYQAKMASLKKASGPGAMLGAGVGALLGNLVARAMGYNTNDIFGIGQGGRATGTTLGAIGGAIGGAFMGDKLREKEEQETKRASSCASHSKPKKKKKKMMTYKSKKACITAAFKKF